MKTRYTCGAWFGAFVVLALGAACGGGGGGGGGSSPTAAAITVQPADRSVVVGTTATFDVVATHATGYQWQRSTDGGATFAAVAGATGPTYTTPVTALADDGARYRVVVSGATSSVTSAAARLTVSAAPALPAFTAGPGEGATVLAPDPATFTVIVTGTPTPTLQWQLSTDGGASWSDLGGATASSYTTPATSAGDQGHRYRVIATNSVGSATSGGATLYVSIPSVPTFTTQPADVAIIAGGNAQFTVAVTGTPTPSLQWQLSADGGSTWSDVGGATGAVFDVLDAALGNDGRRFRAVATNRAGVVNSNAATLTVTPAGLVSITTTSPLPAGTVNAAYGVTLAASGGTPPYTWSVPDGSTLPAFLTLSASTGTISGTLPDVEAVYALNVQVADSANPPNTARGTFELSAVRPCDHGLGFLTVDNAPASVGGKFCPTTVASQLVPNQLGLVWVSWTEPQDYGAGAYYESVFVQFYPVSGVIDFLTYHLSDPTHLVDYDCALTGDAYRRACSGVTLDPATGELFFLNTDVGMTPAFTLRLNGLLFYTP